MAYKTKTKARTNEHPKETFAEPGEFGELADGDGNPLNENEVCWNCMKVVKAEGDEGSWNLCKDCLGATTPYWTCRCDQDYFQPEIVAKCELCGEVCPDEVPMMRMREIVMLTRFWSKSDSKRSPFFVK